MTVTRLHDTQNVGVSAQFCGSAIRQDGKSASLTAPNGQAQQGVLIASLADAKLEPEALNLLEAHGTGTSLGDPIEARAIAAVFLSPTSATNSLIAVGSAKANAGHTEPGAGLLGAVRLLVQLRDATAAPNAQLRVLNPHVATAISTPDAAALSTHSIAIDAHQGGVSSFGYAGTIAHALLRYTRLTGTTSKLVVPANRRGRFSWRSLPHPILQLRLHSSDEKVSAFRAPVAGAIYTLASDHAVQGQILFPGAGYLEFARAVCTSRSSMPSAILRSVFFLKPLVLDVPGIFVECSVVSADHHFEVCSGLLSANALLEASVHCSGSAEQEAVKRNQYIDHALLRLQHGVDSANAQPLYDRFQTLGLDYGPSYRSLARLWASWPTRSAVARLHDDRLPALSSTTLAQITALDGALQLSAFADGLLSTRSETSLPFAVNKTLLHRLESMAIWAGTTEQAPGAANVVLATNKAACLALLDDFKTRTLKASQQATKERRWLYETEWTCIDQQDAHRVSAKEVLARVLVLGGSIKPAETADVEYAFLEDVDKGGFEFSNGRWRAIILTASLSLHFAS